MNQQDFLFELQLHSAAAFFDLTNKDGRHVSVKAVEDFFFQLCKVFSPQLVIEAGAKDARISQRARRYLPEARVVAFEANPHRFATYAPCIDQRDRIEYLNLALDEVSGAIEFLFQLDDGESRINTQARSHSLLKLEDAVSRYKPIPIRAVSLDEYFAQTTAPCAIWIDVEGATGRVLSGGRRVLGAASHLITEVEDRAIWSGQWLRPQVMEFLRQAGFVPVVRDFQSRYQYNIVFVRMDLLETDRFRHALANYFSMIGSRRHQGS